MKGRPFWTGATQVVVYKVLPKGRVVFQGRVREGLVDLRPATSRPRLVTRSASLFGPRRSDLLAFDFFEVVSVSKSEGQSAGTSVVASSRSKEPFILDMSMASRATKKKKYQLSQVGPKLEPTGPSSVKLGPSWVQVRPKSARVRPSFRPRTTKLDPRRLWLGQVGQLLSSLS